MKINIDSDEWYPVHSFHREGDRWFRMSLKTYNISPTKVEELEEVFRKFEEAQEYLKGLIEEK